jgi:putative salt-induced outer membrane protein YdiY
MNKMVLERINFRNLVIIFVLLIFNTLNSAAQKNTEKFREFRSDGFYHTLNFALNMNKGNEEYIKYLADYRLDLYDENFITYLVGNIEYKEGNNKIITNRGFAHYRFIFNKGKFIEPEFFTQIEFNDFLLLKERYLVGSGIRFGIADNYSADSTNRIVFEAGLGMMYEYEKVNDAVKPLTKYIRSTNFVSLRYILNKTLNIFSVTYIQPYAENIDDFRLLNENRLSFSINKHIAFFVSTLFRYDNEPHTNLKYYDFELANGITLNF